MIVQESTTFPAYEQDVRDLVDYHKQIEEEPLLLAVYYAPRTSSRSPHDVFLFEVYDGFHQNRISPEQDFDEVWYGSTEAFPLSREQHLHLVLTNPIEFEEARRADWPLWRELREAVQRGDYKPVYVAPSHESLLETLRG